MTKWKGPVVSSSQTPKSGVLRGLKFLLLAGLVAWGGWSAWQIHQARRAGAALGDALRREPPSSSNTALPARDALAAAAEHLRRGQFAEAASALAPTATLSAAQQDAAKRFLGKQTALRQRLIAAAAAAEKRQREGGDAAAVAGGVGPRPGRQRLAVMRPPSRRNWTTRRPPSISRPPPDLRQSGRRTRAASPRGRRAWRPRCGPAKR